MEVFSYHHIAKLKAAVGSEGRVLIVAVTELPHEDVINIISLDNANRYFRDSNGKRHIGKYLLQRFGIDCFKILA